ncbi:formylmethanofuran dehydrogenase subunit E region [Syntrophobotulus glycolicus DSM 8271]|uniref:Formylmethanofuran dehydrogenase subunit E region n=1 Tax=Syntrophobotulus glycolicus (strain DSM 8271 / FlGlyR) TaxID=645991 RepID=F0T0Z4_SYNGF|nr:FmdE family protein [Syntrophobotulus glycolicus]ADY57365.1 formylmethanofuran dehydrogenase subunit E region [Syntrophobotulus glycolicus DSM 8271]
MCRPKSKWEMSIEFHGHECMGLAIGYQESLLAMRALGVTRAEDEELFAIVETDACGVDAVQVVTGCTLGKGNLIYKDAGKQALTLANRKDNKAVRVIMKPDAMAEDKAFSELRQKIVSHSASEEELARWQTIQKKRTADFLNSPPESLFNLYEVPMPVIEKARLFKTVVCAKCHEPFAEAKARLVDGQIVCGDCYCGYTRGW